MGTSPQALILSLVLAGVALPAGAQQREPAAASADRVMAVRSAVGTEPPQWSPDGTRLLFVSGQGGTTGLWTVPADGGAPSTLLPDIGGVPYQMPQSPRWSPDGKWIAYVSNKGGPAGAPEQPGPSDTWLLSRA